MRMNLTRHVNQPSYVNELFDVPYFVLALAHQCETSGSHIDQQPKQEDAIVCGQVARFGNHSLPASAGILRQAHRDAPIYER